MSDTNVTERPASNREEIMSALFAQLVMQQANMAMMLMGKIAHPQSGETVKDIEAARLFVDQLEMLEAKTKGNLTKEEEGLLKQSLMSLRMAFVEAVQEPAPRAEKKTSEPAAEQKRETGEPTQATASAPEESHKKFTKKY
jgi:hypothetical protein